jgi:hypothetical protein
MKSTEPRVLIIGSTGLTGQAIASKLDDLEQVVTTLRPLLTGRIGQPDDIARVIAYLVSPLASQVTAAEWVVDGGGPPQI